MYVFMNATIKFLICMILVSFIFISHVEDFMVLFASTKLSIAEEHPVNYRKGKEYVPEQMKIGALGENKTLWCPLLKAPSKDLDIDGGDLILFCFTYLLLQKVIQDNKTGKHQIKTWV